MNDPRLLAREDYEYALQLAVERYSDGNLGGCEQLAKGLIALEPADPRPYKLIGSALLLQSYRIAAERYYRKALELDPDDLYTHAALAEIALDALRIADATPHFEQISALDSAGVHPAANRARRALRKACDRFAVSSRVEA
jgi:tetratricopeptide (TPR) repeat protein